mmetsp:Transcript_13861/g.24286  ORF Transcript_13861/g.24286 Transcript_13861/m.24286 type:complete len:145 (-) Transcript_13861:456-890(-)|eukprot:CAMPEP_0119101584 /NCGR_PEP_ID=MMETSP1180-20130426/607_1 /TAXON_ID=3052 ORGANISM="Chlamydomonas cf sp, Strain CCMP681" /NCGR_SAMPLE_ID=MMETSP1180 /ASSEMBLY_ACC=CAM_ASM_000741 /LENGTH=144 /DNA_ID=CAMNT_0007085729 /DNA_START=80 /DNA_END=517 /DNA_ORIENTATION=+
MSSPTPVSRMNTAQLAAILRDPAESSKTLVLDVRDEGFEEGHVSGAVNVASAEFTQPGAAEAFQEKHLKPEAGVQRVVVHCMLSQIRGPRCANHLAALFTRQAAASVGAGAPVPEVIVLSGGWAQWSHEYEADADKDLIFQPSS